VRLSENQRKKLKDPMGSLIMESMVTKENVQKYLSPDSYVITVGDATTEKMIQFGIIPSLQIVDGMEKRIKRDAPAGLSSITNFSCDNPAGEITDDSINIIKKILSSTQPSRLTVNGEEDLLVIPVCIFAPANSVVMYGQPNEGLVIIKITEEIRSKAQLIMDSMN